MPFTSQSLITEIEQRLDHLSGRIKSFTGIGLNDAAKWLEPFAARLLNAVYGWQLTDPDPGNPVTKGIDLTDVVSHVAVQVSVQESAEKIKHTKAMLKDGKLAHFTTVAVFFCHHKKHRNSLGLRIINIGTLLGDLAGKNIPFLQNIIAILDSEIAKHTPNTDARDGRLKVYRDGLITGFQGYDEIGIEKGKEGDDESPRIWKIFVPPACTADRAVSPVEMEEAQRAKPATTPAVPLLPLLADDKNRRHVLLGDPGMGKSTLIQRLTAGLASGQNTPRAPALDSCIPIPIILRDIVPHLPDDPAEWNWSTLCETMRVKYQRSEEAPGIYSPWSDLRSLRDELFNSDHAFFLVDGLDEIGDPAKRKAIRDAIWEGFKTYPRARWLVTSRIVGYDLAKVDREFIQSADVDPRDPDSFLNQIALPDDALLKWPPSDRASRSLTMHVEYPAQNVASVSVHRASLLYLAPFDNEQQDKFAANWFRERKTANPPPGLLEDIRTCEHEGIRVLARVPNLLSYMAILKKDGKPLPDGRAELYLAIARAYLHSIDKAYRLSKKHGHDCPIPFEGRLRLLSVVGAEMQHNRVNDAIIEEYLAAKDGVEVSITDGNIIIPESDVRALLVPSLIRLRPGCDAHKELTEFLRFVASRAGLLLPRGTGPDGLPLYGFTHLSFLEFFAACYLRDELRHHDRMTLAEFNAQRSGVRFDPDDYLQRHPRGPLPIQPTDLETFAARAEWHEVLVFLAELHAKDPQELEPLLNNFFPALHKTDPIPITEIADDGTFSALLPFEAVEVAIKLARDQHLSLSPVVVQTWFVRLWEGFLTQTKGRWPADYWPVAALLLDRSDHEAHAVEALRVAAQRHADLTFLDLSSCRGFTDVSIIGDLWPGIFHLVLMGCTGFVTVNGLPLSIISLSLTDCTTLCEVDHLPISLKTLYLHGCTGLSAVDQLPACLTEVSVAFCTGLTSVDHLPESLGSLNLAECTGLTALDRVPSSLKQLWINGCTGLSAEAVARVRKALPNCAIHGP